MTESSLRADLQPRAARVDRQRLSDAAAAAAGHRRCRSGASSASPTTASARWPIAAVIVGADCCSLFIACGFYMLQPNQAAAITLFGDYKGTDRTTGLRWVLPWMIRKKVSVRANNFISDRIKVNDLRGNPIEMAAQIVWRVVDTAQALFDVDDYKQFVRVQVEAAIRTIGSRYPYDDFEHHGSDAARQSRPGRGRASHRTAGAPRGRRNHRRRMRLHPPCLCPGNRRRDAPPPAGAGRGRRAQDPGRRRGRDGRDGARHAAAKRMSSSWTTSAARRWSPT